ncbi:MAG: 1-deoxy-D-xylulose-5-phosphate synthase [Bacteroidales bacterium]|nr:1-deoxy-D-xylulose-5-phosphate synthase [Bacteroidales bacterium]
MNQQQYPILQGIQSPSDLKRLPESQLPALCAELRHYIIEQTATNPGHLGSSLGTIELTVAIHYVFDTPDDKLVWDVGHQAYAHKILTGRKDDFVNNRKLNGISGFPRMSESVYDAFGVGHSSTSISAVLGMATAADLSGNISRHHIAVIGDGSMTGGEAFEGLNHTGNTNANVLVILNDNGMAIDKNVGALHNYLTAITTSDSYNRIKNKIWNIFTRNNNSAKRGRNLIQSAQKAIKGGILKNSNMFAALGFRYFGPVDGHDVLFMVKVLKGLKNIQGAKLLHCVTVKGKGLKQAEEEQTLYHAPGMFDASTGKILQPPITPDIVEKYQKVFGTTLVELAGQNEKIVGVTPAMASGCSMDIMMKYYPKRVFDVGIAEQHAVTFSAGMATDGYIPFCNIYSTFLQRAYDQIIHDVALQKLHVIFCIDRAGLVGEDGATHHGNFDMAYLRCIPNMIVAAPSNELELRNMMFTAVHTSMPFAIRYPRGKGAGYGWKNEPFSLVPVGKGKCIKQGEKIAVLGIGHITNDIIKAGEILSGQGIEIGIYNMLFVKPLDTETIDEVCARYQIVVTVENGCKTGGFGSAVAEYMCRKNYARHLHIMGIPDEFIEQGTINQLQELCHIDVDSIVSTVKTLYRE